VATAADFTGEPEGPRTRLPLLLRGRLQQSILRYQLQLKQRAPEGDTQYEPEPPSEQFPFSLETATAMVGDYQPNVNSFERRLSFSISTSPDAHMRSVSPAVRASEGGAPKSGLSQSVAHLVAPQDSSYMNMNMNMHDHYGAASDMNQALNGYDSLDEIGLSDRERERKKQKKPTSAPRRGEADVESAMDDKMTMTLLATRLRKRFVEMFVSLLQGYHSCINDSPDGPSDEQLTLVELFDTQKFIRLTTEHFRGFNRALCGYQCFANFVYQRASMIDFDYFDKKVLQHIQIVVRKSNIDKVRCVCVVYSVV
jgi:hypothetical protein